MVQRVLVELDHADRVPLGQDVGPVADDAVGVDEQALVAAELAGVGVQAFGGLDARAVDGEERAEGAQLDEVGGRAFEGDAEGAGVDGLDADFAGPEVLGDVKHELGLLGVGLAAGDAGELFLLGAALFAEGHDALDRVEEVGVVGGEVGPDGAFPGEGEVVGGDGVAVGPLGVFAEGEGVGELVVRDGPGLGGGGSDGAVDGVDLDQGLEGEVHQPEVDHRGGADRVDRLALGRDTEAEGGHVVARGGGLAAPGQGEASGEASGERQGGGQRRQSPRTRRMDGVHVNRSGDGGGRQAGVDRRV